MNYRLCFSIGCVLLLASCASHNQAEFIRNPYGALAGIWHGLIVPIALVTKLLVLVLDLLIALSRWLLVTFGASAHVVNNIIGLFNTFANPLNLLEIIGRPNVGLHYYLGFGVGVLAWVVFLGASSRARSGNRLRNRGIRF